MKSLQNTQQKRKEVFLTFKKGIRMEYVIIGLLVVGGLFLLGGILSGFFVVEQNQEAVVERFGKFVRTAKAGLNFKLPYVEGVTKMDMRVCQLDVDVETKTKDNVFVNMKVSVQFMVTDAVKALYKLKNAQAQISSYVFDVVRAQVPRLNLDDVFERKDDVANAVRIELAEAMDDFGYGIVKTLVTDIDPDKKVKEAMNEINAATRHRQAANEKAEAEKIIKVKQAEGEAEAKALQGRGVANQRKAIIDGLRESISDMSDATGANADAVMTLILMTQYFDTLKSLGDTNGTTTILMPHQPGALGDLQTQIMGALQTNKTSKK